MEGGHTHWTEAGKKHRATRALSMRECETDKDSMQDTHTHTHSLLHPQRTQQRDAGLRVVSAQPEVGGAERLPLGERRRHLADTHTQQKHRMIRRVSDWGNGDAKQQTGGCER